MSRWAKLIRKVELWGKKILTVSFNGRDNKQNYQGCATKNFFCDSWKPPWLCVVCKRLRFGLRHRDFRAHMQFIQTVDKGTHENPQCWFHLPDRDPHTLTREEKRNIGKHFYEAFTRPEWVQFLPQYERTFLGREIKLRLPPLEEYLSSLPA